MGDNSLSTWPFYDDSFMNDNDDMNPIAARPSRDRALINRVLNHKHMIETIERFEWCNLPPELPSDLIERILYFRFKGALFNAGGRFIFLPFTLRGDNTKTIDSYGRYITITPVLFTGQWKVSGDGKFDKDIEFMTNRSYDVVYDLVGIDTEQEKLKSIYNKVNHKAVVLTDSTLEISQDYTPMAYLARPFNEQLTDILVLVNMDLISSAKAFYIIAKDEDQKAAIEQELANLDQRILNGKRYVVVTSAVKLDELTGSSVKDTARYFQSYQSMDNLRKDLIGVENGGTFQKQEHATEMETQANTNSGSYVLNNALRQRKEFCSIANKVFGLNMDVKFREAEESQIVEEKGAQSKERTDDGGEE